MPTTPTDTRLWLKAPGGRIWHLTADVRLQEMAMRWNSVVRNRERWDGDGNDLELMRRALSDLSAIGMDEGVLRILVESGLGEIGVGWQNEELGWEARVMPWEFVIVLATREMRRGRLLTIWRHLDVSGAAIPVQPSAPQRFLFVDSAPGPLKPLVSFQSDRQVLGAALGLDPQVLVDPDADGLAREVRARSPEVIHLGAVDAIEAATLMGQPIDRRRHGLCLAGQSGDLATIAYWRVAETLRTNPVPRLVTFSAQRSSRMAALAIGIGYAEAAVGFQDDIDREGARIFYAEFYRQWSRHRWMPHTAMVQTRVHLRSRAITLGGSGLVLWSNHSLIDRDPGLISGESAAIAAAQAGNQQGAPAVALANPSTAIVEVECEPLPRLNYSLLHNDRDLFKRFVLVSPGDEVVSGVCVRVLLSAGGQDVAWKAQLTLTDVITDLRPKVRVPVVSALGRLKESMRSTVLIEVELAGRLIHQSTHPVQLLAGDEWTDDDQDRQWLPSFVLPRDPAITRIVDQAQRALCTLADDPDAAFDGYQGLGIRAGDDPAEAVDLQAQALWAALTWDIGLAYVNPPPTYTAAAQRVRSPSAVLEERRGTCIDLALLLASSWERIGLRPVIILLKGHALPGYWRSEAAWDAFRRGDHVTVPDGPVTAATAAWMVEQHAEVVGYVRSQALWPVEATRIAKRSGFADAVHAGMDALRLAADFDCLIDISVARDKGVLPLP